MKAESLSVGDVVKNVIVEIKIVGMTRFRVRLWLGSTIVRFGVWVIGCRSEIEIVS